MMNGENNSINKAYGYEAILEKSLGVTTKKVIKKPVADLIRPWKLKDEHPHNMAVSLLDIDAKSDERGKHSVYDLLKLLKGIYGDLENSEKDREKFSKNLGEGLGLFKKASDGYFEQKRGFKTFEKDLIKNFIKKTPTYKDIRKLLFIKGQGDRMSWARAILQRSLTFVHIDEIETGKDLDKSQACLRNKIEERIKKDVFAGIYDAKIIKVIGEAKSRQRKAQKHMKKAGLEDKNITDNNRLRIIVEIEKDKDKNKVLKSLSKKVKEILSSGKNSFEIGEPGDPTRSEYKVEGVWQGNQAEISIYDKESYEKDELYGPYNHDIYEFLGDCHDLARDGMLETEYIEYRVNKLSHHECWREIPEKPWRKISNSFGEILHNGNVKKHLISDENAMGKPEKCRYISPETASDIIRERVKKQGFLNNPQEKKYYRRQDVVRKILLVKSPEEIYEVNSLVEEIFERVNYVIKNNRNNRKYGRMKEITRNDALSIVKGQYDYIDKRVIKIVNDKLKLQLKEKK